MELKQYYSKCRCKKIVLSGSAVLHSCPKQANGLLIYLVFSAITTLMPFSPS